MTYRKFIVIHAKLSIGPYILARERRGYRFHSLGSGLQDLLLVAANAFIASPPCRASFSGFWQAFSGYNDL